MPTAQRCQNMSREQIAAMFPNASRSLFEANATVVPPASVTSALSAPSAVKNKLHRARQPNKTEAEFGHILDARLARGEHRFHSFEAITLQWGDGMKYTGDWVEWGNDLRITIHEIKGGYKWQKDVIRYKGCSAQWRDFFDFKMHEKKNGIWQRID